MRTTSIQPKRLLFSAKDMAIALITTAIAFMIVSCSTIAPPKKAESTTPTLSKEKRPEALNNIRRWQINGKIGVQSRQNAGSASVNWAQNGGQYAISLTGPMGAGNMNLQGSIHGGVLLKTSNEKELRARTAEELLAKAWGYRVPVSHLFYWIRGLSVPSLPTQTALDHEGRLSKLVQQGWHIHYLAYTQQNGLYLPSRIDILSSGLRIKIVIYQWEI